jgi:hypothetical protein
LEHRDVSIRRLVMEFKVRLPLYLTWKALKQLLGWPYERAHTRRMMYEKEYEDRRFPVCRKLGPHRHSHPIWYTPAVLDYYKRHGLEVPENVEFS